MTIIVVMIFDYVKREDWRSVPRIVELRNDAAL